ncbi:MAG TPA: helix-turn-helix domain-containing protein [Candidatus Magasanikbacteria bacterium]|nr:helix-turn-helix domain-containing protein [Candidatus Magasanikbacteria bacterium]
MKVDTKKFSANLKRLRLSKGISQEMLARSADLRLSNLAKLEGGFNVNPTLQTLTSLAHILTQGSIDRLLQ